VDRCLIRVHDTLLLDGRQLPSTGVTRRRLHPDDRRAELIDAGADAFASTAYDDVNMDDIAQRAGASRALLYRYFSSKRTLFAAIYRRAAEQLLESTAFDPRANSFEQVTAGLEAHIAYFIANRHTVLAANVTLAGDPLIQAIISDELAEIRHRMLAAFEIDESNRPVASAALHAWLQFVRVMCVEWLQGEAFTRQALRDVCLGSLEGALDAALAGTIRRRPNGS
jgi:AcrR family transcriptional regulator